MYRNCLKRVFDFCCSLFALIVLSPILLVFIILGVVFMKGNPFFTQPRPGKDEKIFNLIKFRTMSNAKDKHGKLLPDEMRLNSYGKFLRSTSIDELPELLNILRGDMAVIGPRPQLVRDMVFMSPEQRSKMPLKREDYTDIAKVELPDFFNEMLGVAKDLCKGFPFVRVDFFLANDRYYFAELTFTPSACMMPFNPDKYDMEWGKMIELVGE